MAKQEYVSFDRAYIHSPKWRTLHASAFRTGLCLWSHCDHFGLIGLQPANTLRYFLENRPDREWQIAGDIRELQDHQVVYTYKHIKHGLVACLPDFPACNYKKFPSTSIYLPIPDAILFAEPDYADIIVQYQARLGGTLSRIEKTPTSGKPTLAQGIALWNAFAGEHSTPVHRLPQANLTSGRIPHWNARIREPLFDFDTILKACTESDWLMGKVKGRNSFFNLTFDYLTDGPNNYVSILEGKYKTRANSDRAGDQGTSARTSAVPEHGKLRKNVDALRPDLRVPPAISRPEVPLDEDIAESDSTEEHRVTLAPKIRAFKEILHDRRSFLVIALECERLSDRIVDELLRRLPDDRAVLHHIPNILVYLHTFPVDQEIRHRNFEPAWQGQHNARNTLRRRPLKLVLDGCKQRLIQTLHCRPRTCIHELSHCITSTIYFGR
jgi:hypothetical protein